MQHVPTRDFPLVEIRGSYRPGPAARFLFSEHVRPSH